MLRQHGRARTSTDFVSPAKSRVFLGIHKGDAVTKADHLAAAEHHTRLGKIHATALASLRKAREMEGQDEDDDEDCQVQFHKSATAEHAAMASHHLQMCKAAMGKATDDIPMGDTHAEWLQELVAREYQEKAEHEIHLGDIHGAAALERKEAGDASGEKVHLLLQAEHRRMAEFYESLPKVEGSRPTGSLYDSFKIQKAQGMDRFDAIVPDGISGIVGEIPQHIRPVLRAGQREFGKVTDGMDAVLAKTIFGDENE
jgi:hypothetical protein